MLLPRILEGPSEIYNLGLCLQDVFGFGVGVPEPSVDMGTEIVHPPPIDTPFDE